MAGTRLRQGAATVWCLLCTLEALVTRASAQSPTTAAIAGRVLDESGRGLAGAEVSVTNRASGGSVRAISRGEGRYLVSGLEVGGPYSVTVRRMGSPSVTRTGFVLSVGQQLQVDVTLEQQPTMVRGMETRVAPDRLFSRAHKGTEALLSDSLIHQMPVINRDLYDLIRLVPQMSTWYALSASGAGPRVNSIRIDGISDQVPSSNLASGALYGGRVIPLDAVKEYQVSLSPFDVRQGSFAGASVNVVTRSGTNDLHGSVFGYATSERFGADAPSVRNVPYSKEQLGFALGGPVIRDKLFFFTASELQRREIRAPGPYVSQGLSGQSGLPVSVTDIARFQQLLRIRGLDGGSAGAVTNDNPSSSIFVRLDAPIPRWNSRVTLRGNDTHADSAIFARPTMLAPTSCPSAACFPLSSLQHSRWVDKRSAAVQLRSNFRSGADNELLAGYTRLVSGFRPTADQPLILVTVPGTMGMPAVLQSGTHEIATGQRNASWTMEFTDNLAIPAGAHRFTVGLSAQFFALRAFQLRGSYGIWEFTSLDSLQAGAASRYRVTRDTGSVTAASGAYHALYVSDDWEVSPRLSLTFGLRADVPVLSARPPDVAGIDSAFGVRTDAVPTGQVQWSPRFGFNYRLTNDDEAPAQLRGGVGLFTGRPPLFWLFGGFSAYGLAARTLQCGSLSTDAGPAPEFRTDYRNPPLTCAGGQTFGAATNGEIDVIDPRLRLPQTLRASIAVDRQLPFGLVGTIEGLYTRSTSGMFFTPINLAPPAATDGRGRAMYGAIAATGMATPRRISSRYADVVNVTNESRDVAYDITGELRKESRFADVEASVSFGRARDVATPRPVSALLTDNWRFSRPVSGRQDDLTLGVSDFDQPIRVRASGTLHSPWRRFSTDLSIFYVGGSGFPYTYIAGGTGGRGDLNADGAVGNDPIYIPRSAFDTAEMTFGGSESEVRTQQAAFERFVEGAPCLRAQRGRIMSRNSCRSPWTGLTNVAVRQAVPGGRSQSFVLEGQVFNILNMLNSHWGRVSMPTGAVLANTNQMTLLSQIGETAGPDAQPVYRFDPMMNRYSSDNLDTYYQIQLAVRYIF